MDEISNDGLQGPNQNVQGKENDESSIPLVMRIIIIF
jgi:hypothetical protein